MASSFKRPSSSSLLISAQVRDSLLFVIYASSMPNRHRERQRGGGEGSVGVREAGREGRRERERESSEITTAQVGYCLLHWSWTIRFVRVFCNGLRQQQSSLLVVLSTCLLVYLSTCLLVYSTCFQLHTLHKLDSKSVSRRRRHA
jgi:hypothetical protein